MSSWVSLPVICPGKRVGNLRQFPSQSLLAPPRLPPAPSPPPKQVLDRAFVHGDIVAQVAAPLGQSGAVVGVHLEVGLGTENTAGRSFCFGAGQPPPFRPLCYGKS